MTSWFNLDVNIDDIKSKVKAAIPEEQREMLEKLTLTTPELKAERERIDEEERRKERVRDSLAGMLPWETRDEEREILVEECKEAILQLSSEKSTFFGPYAMPEKPVLVKDDDDDDDEEEEEDEEPGPSEEQLEKLANLEPLPSLLSEFDLDTHVGLIQLLLDVDPKLVEMQSVLSGAGERERTFWRNYFFHCAWTRYEAGLSIDEIWSDQPAPASIHESLNEADEESEEITFEATPNDSKDNASDVASAASSAAAALEPENATDTVLSSGNLAKLPSSQPTDGEEKAFSKSPSSLVASDYELVGREAGEEDAELDELEAEIARELED